MNQAQLRYLEAMEIEVWVARGAPVDGQAATPLFRLGPGSSAQLFICRDNEFSSGRLAADIMRSLAEQAVWAWPASDAEGVPAADLIDDRLITSVVVFGEDLAVQLFGRPVPETLGTARLIVVADPDSLARESSERRELWQTFLDHGLAGSA